MSENATVCAVSPRPWWDVHARLMPDYNGKATVYWWTVVTVGAAVLGASICHIAEARPGIWLHIGLCAGLAMLAGLVPVRVPGSNNSFTAGEIFIFLLLLLDGTEAATLACACEAFVGSCRTSTRWTSRIASPAMAALALFLSGSLLQLMKGQLADRGLGSGTELLLSSILFSLVYFLINTFLVTMVPRLKRNEPMVLRSFFGSFGWLGLAYSANAVVASFLYLSFIQVGWMAVVAAAPVIAILLTTGHYFFRRKEADEAVRSAQASEAEQARQHVEDLKASEQRFHSAFTNASIGMALVSFDGQLRQVNTALKSLLGLHEDGNHRLHLNQFIADDGVTTLANLIASFAAGDKTSFADELQCLREDGMGLWVAVNGSFFTEPGSSERGLILQLQDITARKDAEAKLHHTAFHDGLTGLPNRHRFNEYLTQAIERARVRPDDAYAVLFLDFDRFKVINDSLGHTIGDEFLVQVARRIEECMRAGDIVARLGGDEFAILVQGAAAATTITALAERLQQTLRLPFSVAGTEVTISASMGITFSTIGYSTPEEVLRDADIAMYKAKANGKARYALYDVGLHQQVVGRLRLEGELRRALADNALSVEYQPLFELIGSRLVGFEALARWSHPELGQISPASFIPIAEESGLMIQLTDFVLATGCAQLKRWHQLHPTFSSLKLHVNIAGNDVLSDNFVSRVAGAVVSARLRPEHLSIELTENILMESLESAMGKLRELSELGIGLSIDDFGTGYSSLSHLSTLPVDSLKIDQSFVRNLIPGSKEAAVLGAVVLLGNSLGKEIIVEGIETSQQLATVIALGCKIGQGYFLGRPMTSDKVDVLLQNESSVKPRPEVLSKLTLVRLLDGSGLGALYPPAGSEASRLGGAWARRD